MSFMEIELLLFLIAIVCVFLLWLIYVVSQRRLAERQRIERINSGWITQDDL